MQQVMSLCWEQEPASRPQISQILKWCELSEFQSLRAVSSLDKGNFHVICQCTVDRTNSHTLSSNLPNNIKFTLQHCNTFDQLFSVPEIVMLRSDSHAISHNVDSRKSKHHTQVWITQEVDELKSQLQILTYRATQIGYRVSICDVGSTEFINYVHNISLLDIYNFN